MDSIIPVGIISFYDIVIYNKKYLQLVFIFSGKELLKPRNFLSNGSEQGVLCYVNRRLLDSN